MQEGSSGMDESLRVLHVEDSADDTELIKLELRRGGFSVTGQRVETEEDMRRALEGGKWDIVLSDHVMPGFSSEAALGLLRELGLDVPFVIVSGAIGEERAVEAVRVLRC